MVSTVDNDPGVNIAGDGRELRSAKVGAFADGLGEEPVGSRGNPGDAGRDEETRMFAAAAEGSIGDPEADSADEEDAALSSAIDAIGEPAENEGDETSIGDECEIAESAEEKVTGAPDEMEGLSGITAELGKDTDDARLGRKLVPRETAFPHSSPIVEAMVEH